MSANIGRTVATSLILVLELCILVPGQASADSVQEATVVLAVPGPIGPPRTDGHFVVWTAREGGDDRTPHIAIYAADLRDRRIQPVITGPGVRALGAIDGGVIVWSAAAPDQPAGSQRVEAHDLATGRTVAVSAGAGHATRPVVGGDWVAWMHLETFGSTTTRQLQARNLRTMAPPVVLASLEGTLVSAAITGTRLIWAERVDGGAVDTWRVGGLTLGSGDPPVISRGPALRATGDGYAIAGDLLVFGSAYAGRLVAVDIPGGPRQTVTAHFGGGTVATDSRFVVWAAEGGLVAYDVRTGSAFAIPGADGADAPALAHGSLAWRGGTTDVAEIHVARFAALLPSAPWPFPTPEAPEQRFFPETGHRLAFGFKAFWEQHGDLPIFGYPRTEEFGLAPAELDSEQEPYDRRRTVQYLERQRFEYHPEHTSTPYEVELGQLGVEEARRRGLLSTAPFQPRGGDRASEATCRFFTETGHWVCGDFRTYWEGRGLDFGDAGVSDREALALFGYPISEAFPDPATGRIIQYFERARFERHPENAAPYQVLLGRLGAEALAAFGW